MILILMSVNRIQQNKSIKTLTTEPFFFLFSLQVPERRMEGKQTADVDLHVKAYRCGENRKHTTKTQICTRMIELIQKKKQKIMHFVVYCSSLHCFSQQVDLTIALLSETSRYRSAEFVLRPLWSVQRGKWTCSKESSKASMFTGENLAENYSPILISSRALKFKCRTSSFSLILYGDVVALQLIKIFDSSFYIRFSET